MNTGKTFRVRRSLLSSYADSIIRRADLLGVAADSFCVNSKVSPRRYRVTLHDTTEALAKEVAVGYSVREITK